jgi:3-deoxy-D-manno-octulosonic-acid transferase
VINAYDIAWGVLLGAAAPVWLLVPKARRKVRRALSERMGRGVRRDVAAGPAVMIHAVSLGEINATGALVRALADARPNLRFVVSTTTDTGFARGRELYGGDAKVTLVRYPLDFSVAIRRVLDGVRPEVVVLMELEVWPNFIAHCRRRNIPVLLINGRLTESSYRNYRRARALVFGMFASLSEVCAQDEAYARRFVELGAPKDRVRVTGTMKFDNAQVADTIDGVVELAQAVGLRPGEEQVWVCGSTGPGEEELILEAYQAIRTTFPGLRLVIVPRHPERFDGVASLLQERFPLVRRSDPQTSGPSPSGPAPIILGDTMGELRKFYALADVVFVGRSLVDLGPRQHGSDMIEPAALGKPVIVGPYTTNFADAMLHLRAADAIKVVGDGPAMTEAVGATLADPGAAAAMGRRAQAVVRHQQGATARNAEVILAMLPGGT